MSAPEPFWQRWQSMLAPVRLQAADTLALTLTEEARLPVLVQRGYRGLDRLRAELKCGCRG